MSDTPGTPAGTSGAAAPATTAAPDSSGGSTPSGSGHHHADVSVNLDPMAFEELMEKHSAGEDKEEAKTEAKAGTAAHQLSIDVSGMTWAEVQSKLGTTDFLPDIKASLTPQQANNQLQADVHADLIQQKWAEIGGVALTTGLGGDLVYTDKNGMSEKLDIKQDVKFKQATLEATLTTDFSSGSPQVTGTVGLKFSF